MATLGRQIAFTIAVVIFSFLNSPFANAAGLYVPVDISPHFNWRIQTLLGAAPSFPDGPVNYLGVPFSRPASGDNAWNGWYEVAGSMEGLRTIDIPVGQYGVQEVHTLINTMGGEKLPGTFAWFEFYGTGGAFYQRNLDGNSDVRDYLFGDYTNSINGTTTVNGFTAGSGLYSEVRLDMQTFDLPTAFETQTLQTIRVIDNGGTIDGVLKQRLILSGVTLHSIPEPSTLAIAVLGLGLVLVRFWQCLPSRR